jgi:hypothetical protein
MPVLIPGQDVFSSCCDATVLLSSQRPGRTRGAAARHSARAAPLPARPRARTRSRLSLPPSVHPRHIRAINHVRVVRSERHRSRTLCPSSADHRSRRPPTRTRADEGSNTVPTAERLLLSRSWFQTGTRDISVLMFSAHVVTPRSCSLASAFSPVASSERATAAHPSDPSTPPRGRPSRNRSIRASSIAIAVPRHHREDHRRERERRPGR